MIEASKMTNKTRDRILDAAVRLLEEQGSRGFRQTRIAEEADVRQSHLTYYFPTRSDLAVGVFERIIEQQRADAIERVPRADDAGLTPERLLKVVKQVVLDPRRARLLLALALETQDEPALTARIRENQRRQREMFASLFGREEDDLEIDLVLSCVRGLAVDQLVAPRSKERVDALFDLLAARLVPAPKKRTKKGAKRVKTKC
jgi:AcrR family transcriptional regulator